MTETITNTQNRNFLKFRDRKQEKVALNFFVFKYVKTCMTVDDIRHKHRLYNSNVDKGQHSLSLVLNKVRSVSDKDPRHFFK